MGGVCFALDLSQAFDMVSRRDLLDTLRAAGADSALIDLVAALRAESTYSFRTQGQEGQVVSTTGIKQGCKLAPTLFSMLTGTIFRELIALVGVQAVVDYLTGYADDLTVHREIHSMEDLGRAHALIEQLLALVRKHGFAVNPSKCTMMVKLEGTQAQRALRRFTYWRAAPDGQRQKMWRLGQAKSHEGFPSVTSFKYLGLCSRVATLRRPPSSIACRKAMPSCNRCAGLCTTVARLDLARGCTSGAALYGQRYHRG